MLAISWRPWCHGSATCPYRVPLHAWMVAVVIVVHRDEVPWHQGAEPQCFCLPVGCWILDWNWWAPRTNPLQLITHSHPNYFVAQGPAYFLGVLLGNIASTSKLFFLEKRKKKKKRPEYRSSWSVLDSEDLIWFGLDLNSIGAYLIWVRWIRLGPAAPATANYGNLMYHTPITTKWPMFVKGADICLPI